MDAPLSPTLFWVVAAVLGMGLCSAIFARRSEGSTWQTFSQCAFFACLLTVGVIAMLSSLIGPECWGAASGTLAVMVLAVTYEPRRSGQQTAW
jgi:hypothetical protein